MGQLPDLNVQAGAGTLECYQCGVQGYRQMTAAMASMVPGGCTKVDPALCAAGTGTGTAPETGTSSTNPWTGTGGSTPIQGGGLAVGTGAGNLDVKFTVFRADKARAITGVRVASSVVLTATGAVVSTLPDQVAGEGDSYLIHATSPAPKRAYTLKVVVTPEPGGIAFDKVTASIPMYQPNEPEIGSSALMSIGRGIVICPKGASELVCEVGRKQLMYLSILKQQSNAWQTSVNNGFVANTAHALMQESGVSDPLLAKYWYNEISFIVADVRIPPEDFPQLLKNYDQMKRVWNEIPWPGEGTLKGLFQRCAAGVRIHKDYRVFVDGPLYAPSMSAFFPKEDAELRKILAMTFLSDLAGIYYCMHHKIEKKIQNLERQEKKWKVIGLVLSIMALGAGDFMAIAVALAKAGIALNQMNSALDFSRFMMGYNDFVSECAKAEAKDFTCEYMAPFILWCMQAVFYADFIDYVAIKAGLPGAREGLTQEEAVKPLVEAMQGAGVNVPPAAQNPGGTAPSTGQALAVVAGIGGLSAAALLLFGGFTR
jgi:hypothetical protein